MIISVKKTIDRLSELISYSIEEEGLGPNTAQLLLRYWQENIGKQAPTTSIEEYMPGGVTISEAEAKRIKDVWAARDIATIVKASPEEVLEVTQKAMKQFKRALEGLEKR